MALEPHGYPPPSYPPPDYGYGSAYGAPAAAYPGYPPEYGYAYGAPPAYPSYGYGAPPPGYGPPPPGPEGYGAPPPGYGAPPPPGYGAPPPPGYGAPYGAAASSSAPGYGALEKNSSYARRETRDTRDTRDRDRQRKQAPGRIEPGERRKGKEGGKKGRGKGKGKDRDKEKGGNEKKQEGGEDASAEGGAEGGKGKGRGKGKGKGKGKKGKVATKIAWGEPCFVGRLRNYNAEKKAGIIACAEAYAMCGQEVYAYGSVLETAKVGVGDTMVFFIHWSNWGQPQASYELLRIHSMTGMALKGTFKMADEKTGGEKAIVSQGSFIGLPKSDAMAEEGNTVDIP
ncbi:unnamed protein product [Effrenium voratum]|uniref:Uncharacterized protein n=1 Tax=Effrenium voratum TaxID=2562239 RepID=A0AA36HUW7_9DINO|nr:unnamed protein product [Effrenium voratum]